MKNITFLVFLCCFLCLQSANGQQKKNPKLEYLKKTGEKKIVLDSLTSAFESIFYPKFQTLNGKKAITFLNQPLSILYVYDYETGNLIKSIDLVSEVHNIKKGSVITAYPKSIDSIFVLADGGQNFYLIDSKKNTLKTYKKGDFLSSSSNKAIRTTDSTFLGINCDFKILDNYLYALTALAYGPQKYVGNHSVMVRYDITTGKREKLDMHYPLRYQKEYFGVDLPSMLTLWHYYTFNPKTKQFVHGFPIDENIYVADKDYKDVKSYPSKSQFIDYIKPLDDKEVDAFLKNHSLAYCNTRGMYYVILYDEYRDVYYREVRIPVKDEEKASKIRFFEVPRSIIVFDNKFQKIGEYRLPTEPEYDFTNAICTPEGLLIPRTAGDNEDILIFDIFNPLKK
ncbi:MAG: DUF4221 domain-containing protein [Bacteroidetes bacterium]|nr:MAG: DUF4221 domain-containing protein [Bacteroidota bacterium]